MSPANAPNRGERSHSEKLPAAEGTSGRDSVTLTLHGAKRGGLRLDCISPELWNFLLMTVKKKKGGFLYSGILKLLLKFFLSTLF